MRGLTMISLLLLFAWRSSAQEEPSSATMISSYEEILHQSYLSQQESTLIKAFKEYPTEASAHDYYYWLLDRGHDLEAARFRQENLKYTYAFKPYRRGFESIYAEPGLRISANNQAGNIVGGGYGGLFRVSGTTRIWHSVSYLRQDDNLGHYKQGEYFSALQAYLGKGWTIRPSLHYVYLDFTSLLHETTPVTYSDTTENRRGVQTILQTNATQDIDYTLTGHSHFLHVGLPVTRRLYQWTLEASPSLHFIRTNSRRTYQYTTVGTTDSFRMNRQVGTGDYLETGSGNLADTTTNLFIGQLGGSIGYQFRLLGKPVFIRAGAWYLWQQGGENAAAVDAYALIQASPKVWFHLSYMAKGNLPFAPENEGLYLNTYHTIKARPGLTVQLFPLRHWSPMLTYQYEQQQRYGDGTTLIYHALYLTLKYQL